MKVLLAVIALLVGLGGGVNAAERTQQIDPLGGFQTADAIVRASAVDIVGVSITCGGTACAGSLYDGDLLDDMSNANGKFEWSAAANATTFFDLRDFPVKFRTGVVLNIDTNTTAAAIFTVASP